VRIHHSREIEDEEEMEGDVVEGEEEEGEDPFEQDMKREAEQRMLQAEKVPVLNSSRFLNS